MMCIMFINRVKGSNVGVRKRGAGGIDANIWIACATIVVLPPFSYTISLCSTPVYSESDTHPSSETSSVC